MLSLATALAGLTLVATMVGACDQSEGERCQRTADCAEGLTCNLGTQLCQADDGNGTSDGGVDTPLDAEEPDAAPDATPDAAIDAAPI